MDSYLAERFRTWMFSTDKQCFIWYSAKKDDEAHRQDAPTVELRPVCIYRVDNLSFSAEGGWIYRDGHKFMSGNIMPQWSDMTTEDPDIRRKFCVDVGDEIGEAYILTHNPTDPYGHFLLEMAPKLMALALFSEAGFDIPILLSWYTPSYVTEWITFIAPTARLVRIPQTRRIKVRRSYYCDMFLDGYWPTPAFDLFINICLQNSKSTRENAAPERVFISRRSRRQKKSDFRFWDNEDATEQALLAEGFVSIEPETMSIPEQIQTFYGAKIIVGELSSALHNAIFASAGARIIQINPFNDVQRRLSVSLGHCIKSILPDSGQACGWPAAAGRPKNFSVETERILKVIFATQT